MTTAHTPGPWVAHIQGDTQGRLRLIRGQHPDLDGSDVVVASGIRPRDLPLFLAAPDMLAALERLVSDAWNVNDGSSTARNTADEAFRHAKEIIAKAQETL